LYTALLLTEQQLWHETNFHDINVYNRDRAGSQKAKDQDLASIPHGPMQFSRYEAVPYPSDDSGYQIGVTAKKPKRPNSGKGFGVVRRLDEPHE